MSTKNKGDTSNTIALNKKARHDYFIEDRFEAGLVLEGWEVTSLRAGRANLAKSWTSSSARWNASATPSSPSRSSGRGDAPRSTSGSHAAKNSTTSAPLRKSGNGNATSNACSRHADALRRPASVTASHRFGAEPPLPYTVSVHEPMGATWFRRGLQNLRCMPRCSFLVKLIANL